MAKRATHGATRAGKPWDSEYIAYRNMLARCYNPNYESYENYGKRGIGVCQRWRDSYKDFLADMGQKPFKHATLEREDGDKDYSPQNCRWASAFDQSRNRSVNRFVDVDGKRLCHADAAELLGVPRTTFVRWLDRGLSIDQIRKQWSERSHRA